MARCPAAEPPRSSAIRLWRVIEFFEDDVGILADDRRRSEYPARRSGELEEAPWLLESMDRESAAYLTFTGPPSDATYSWTPEWRRAEIGAANGHGNARSVAKIQSVVSNGGEVNGVKLLSPKTVDLIFQEQSKGSTWCSTSRSDGASATPCPPRGLPLPTPLARLLLGRLGRLDGHP